MSLALLIRRLSEAGAPPEAIAIAVEAVETERAQLQAELEERRAHDDERKRKDRERKSAGKFRGNSMEFHGTSAEIQGSSAEIPAETLSLPLSPQTPLSPTHTRVSVTTREGDTREEAAWVRFWAAYPRKTAKAEARKAFTRAWKKLPPHDEEAVLIGGLERAKAAWVDAQFIPHAATWLNGERWNDEPPTVTPLRAHERPHPDHRQAAREDNLRSLHAGAMEALNRRLG